MNRIRSKESQHILDQVIPVYKKLPKLFYLNYIIAEYMIYVHAIAEIKDL